LIGAVADDRSWLQEGLAVAAAEQENEPLAACRSWMPQAGSPPSSSRDAARRAVAGQPAGEELQHFGESGGVAAAAASSLISAMVHRFRATGCGCGKLNELTGQ
jgi:hypothetical protein